jgi:hypothetical protein
MPIRTWGEFEGALIEIIPAIVAQANPGSMVSGYTASLYMSMEEAITGYYNQMRTGDLGEPNAENLERIMGAFWEQLSQDPIIERVNMNQEGFFAMMNAEITRQQELWAAHRNTIEDIACFRFAADGRLDDGEYWLLEQTGNLAAMAKQQGVDIDEDSRDFRTAIMSELGRHASRQCGQEMGEGVTVYLCGGYGGSGAGDGADIGHGQLLPEHMWLEVHREGQPTISIDTFPSRPHEIPPAMIGARLNENFEGAPSEQNRVHTADKTFKQRIPGLPLGVMQALAQENYTIHNDQYMRVEGGQQGGLFIRADGTLLQNEAAVAAFEALVAVEVEVLGPVFGPEEAPVLGPEEAPVLGPVEVPVLGPVEVPVLVQEQVEVSSSLTIIITPPTSS